MNEHDPKQTAPSGHEADTVDHAARKTGPDTKAEADEHASGEIPPTMPEVDTAVPASAATTSHGRIATGILIAVLVILAGGEAWLFKTQGEISDQSTQVANLTDQVDSLRGKLDTLDNKIGALSSKIQTIDDKVASVAKVQAKAPANPPPASVPADITGRISKIEANLASLSTTTLADHAAITKLQQQGGNLPKLVAKAQQLAAVAQASLNLENGLKLGTVPGAPPALARYADAAPPTLAGLKESFGRYASAAARVAGDTTPQGGFWQKVKGRVESLVTVRHHDKVLVGSSASGTLGKAQEALDRDDLQGALESLKALTPAASAAMKPWTDQASDLLAARAALAKMAEQG